MGRKASERSPPSPIGLDLDLKRDLKVSAEVRLSFLKIISEDVAVSGLPFSNEIANQNIVFDEAWDYRL